MARKHGIGRSKRAPSRPPYRVSLATVAAPATTNYGHFGKVDDLDTFTWERTDKVAALKEAVK